MSERISSGPPTPQGLNEDPLTHWARVFCRFLQVVHATWDKTGYHWSPDELNTDITIQDQGTIQREVVERRPAIIVALGASSWTNVSLDSTAGPYVDKDGKMVLAMDPVTASTRRTDLISGMMTYNCISRSGVEARRIAWFCSYATKTLKRALMRAGVHRVGEEVQISAESSPGAIVQPDANEIMMVSVSVPFWFQDTWTTTPEDKVLLTQVGTVLTSELRTVSGNTVLNEPSINGRAINYADRTILSQPAVPGPYPSPRPRR